ncbi:glycosyltransferase family 4 protein [Wenyingzhuangia marina]|uniref:Glycosyl transferases group 1 n=1 Tax=Wenyingzhuangia marina TaxID=1195760 RepID=A0A1M5X1F8_9FLAO|nr:glycosyltransferase family 4 protein [Wenyingzhuangia marina]GGF60900.1 hypothetical protein GCM10011397_00060 [Wenyingzhuangia marina]SHH93560.1 Glycosyl transferases group 1 [Wenyingzhuangia marina]
MKKNKVLFFGPYPFPITGQSISFREVYDNFRSDKILFDTTKYGDHKLLNSLHSLMMLPFVFMFFRFDKVYFTCTRSKLGFIKDFQLLLFCKIFNKKVINHLHGADFNSFINNSKWLKKVIKWAYQIIDTSIVLLPSMKSHFSDFPKMKIEVVRNCYTSEYEDIEVNLNEKKRQVIYLSNIINSKGVFVFLEAIETVLQKDKEVVVKIAGKIMEDETMIFDQVSDEFNRIKQELKQKYPDRFFYLGLVSGKEKEQLLMESSIFVLPTFYKSEASPISIIEAMRFGNAIITTKHNYLTDLVSDKNGFIINPNSVSNLVVVINKILRNETKLRAIQEYNIQESIKKYSPVFFNSEIARIIT